MTSQCFSMENASIKAESLVGAYREEPADDWIAASGITAKMPPLFDVSTSWFKNEELMEDWFDLTVLEAGKRGPALKKRLVGDAAMHEGLLSPESLRAGDGVKYFRHILRPLWSFFSILSRN